MSRNRQPTLPGIVTSKRCSKCTRHLPVSEFPTDESRFDGLAYVCRGCRSTRTSPGPTLFERAGRLAVSGEAWCRGCEDWRQASEVRHGRCRGCHSAAARERYRSDPRYRAERRQHAHARKRGVDPVPVDGQETILEVFEGRCAYCHEPATTWDHIIPVSRGGPTERWNIVPACVSCNSSKGDRDLEDWIEAGRCRDLHPEVIETILLEDCGMGPPLQ